jgi:hypothetical protein
MPTLKEIVNGQSAEISQDTSRAVIMRRCVGIDLTTTSYAAALINCFQIAGFPQLGSAMPGASWLKLARVQLLPSIEQEGNDAMAALEYLHEPLEFTPTAYIIRDETYTVSQRTPIVPGTTKPITVRFDAQEDQEFVPSDIVIFNFLRPMRSLGITALRATRPHAFGDKVGYVNDNDWPEDPIKVPTSLTSQLGGGPDTQDVTGAGSKPKGYWMLQRFATEYNRSTGYTLMQAQAVSRVIDDWSEIGTLINRQTNKYPFGALAQGTQDATVAAIMGADYLHGIIAGGNGQAEEGMGIIRVGPYPMTGFKALFGF